MEIGAALAQEIRKLVECASPTIKLECRYYVVSDVEQDDGNEIMNVPVLAMIFTVARLEGSSEDDVHRIVSDRLLSLLKELPLAGRKILWALEVES